MGQASAQSLPSQPDALTEKIGTLSMMYQNYMQRISNMIYSNQLNGVEEAVAEFWMNFPKDSLDMLENEEFVRQIEIYDTLFFSVGIFSCQVILKDHNQLTKAIKSKTEHPQLNRNRITRRNPPTTIRRLTQTFQRIRQLAPIRYRIQNPSTTHEHYIKRLLDIFGITSASSEGE